MNLAGCDVSEQLKKCFIQNGNLPTQINERRLMHNIKEQLCYVALDFDNEISTTSASNNLRRFELPDGNIINVGNERFSSTEILFQPKLMGMDLCGVHEIVNESIMDCETEFQKDLFANIVVSGGTVQLPGFIERIRKEITGIVAQGTNIGIHPFSTPEFQVWRGASIVSTLSTFKEVCVSKQQYAEPSLAHLFCRSLNYKQTPNFS